VSGSNVTLYKKDDFKRKEDDCYKIIKSLVTQRYQNLQVQIHNAIIVLIETICMQIDSLAGNFLHGLQTQHKRVTKFVG
jgi:hypothetical protein